MSRYARDPVSGSILPVAGGGSVTSADAEAWAVGERAGQPVDPGDPTFHNNAKYYAGQAEDAVSYGIVDMVGATATTNGSHGAAVQPVAGQQNHYLKGDGTWSREDMTVTEITDSAPYLYRASKGGDRQYDKLIGGSVVWNQLVNTSDTSCTVQSGHKYIFKHSTTYTVAISDGTAFTVDGSANDNVHDLTLMFGTTIADYVYVREIAETGSGIAWLKSYGFFGKDYYAYDAGSLLSVNTSGHKLTGKNQFDGVYESGYYNQNGKQNGSGWKRCSDYIKVISNQSYTLSGTIANQGNYTSNAIYFYTDSGDFISSEQFDITTITFSKTFITPINCGKIGFHLRAAIAIKNITTQLEVGSTATAYTPYVAPTTYPLTSTDLRGTLSLSGNDLVYDGDVYESDGTCTRNYLEIDLGDCTWGKSSSYDNLFVGSVVNYAYKLQTNVSALCDAYPYVGTALGPGGASSKGDNTLVLYHNSTNSDRKIYINDSSKWSMTAEQFGQSLIGKKLIVLIATPTTATLSPFVSPQICDKYGTEEYIDTRTVPMPVGHESDYYNVPDWMVNRYFDDLRAFPDKAESEIAELDSDKAETTDLAPVESGATASQAYTTGQYIERPDGLYKVTADIANGGTFTVGTNISKTTIAAELLAIIAQLNA